MYEHDLAQKIIFIFWLSLMFLLEIPCPFLCMLFFLKNDEHDNIVLSYKCSKSIARTRNGTVNKIKQVNVTQSKKDFLLIYLAK